VELNKKFMAFYPRASSRRFPSTPLAGRTPPSFKFKTHTSSQINRLKGRLDQFKGHSEFTGPDIKKFLEKRAASKTLLNPKQRKIAVAAAKKAKISAYAGGDEVKISKNQTVSAKRLENYAKLLEEGGFKFRFDSHKHTAEGLIREEKKLKLDELKNELKEEIALQEKTNQASFNPAVQAARDRIQNLTRPEETSHAINTKGATSIEDKNINERVVSAFDKKPSPTESEEQRPPFTAVKLGGGIPSSGINGPNKISDSDSKFEDLPESTVGTDPKLPSKKEAVKNQGDNPKSSSDSDNIPTQNSTPSKEGPSVGGLFDT
jgi:hypothetical protein